MNSSVSSHHLNNRLFKWSLKLYLKFRAFHIFKKTTEDRQAAIIASKASEADQLKREELENKNAMHAPIIKRDLSAFHLSLSETTTKALIKNVYDVAKKQMIQTQLIQIQFT